jgi:hypothetical protein
MKLLEIASVDFDIDHLNGTVHKILIDSEKAFDPGEKYCTVFSLNFVYL